MKYDVLNAYREYLGNLYTGCTARTYYIRLSWLLKGQAYLLELSPTGDLTRLDFEKILSQFEQIKHRNYFSQSKNAFLHFCKFYNVQLTNDFKRQLQLIEKTKKKKYRRFTPIEFSDIDKKIKYLRNKKLKISFQTLIATGLRISELTQITPNTMIINDEYLVFNFRGKGGGKESTCLYKKEYPKLYGELTHMITNIPKDEKIFYSARYLQDKAKQLGFKCHDLRRASAKIEYKKTKNKISVMKKLRHKSIKNTNIYLKSKVKV